jgi:beta-lactamase regulating signal transducer with metallopeptidase domain
MLMRSEDIRSPVVLGVWNPVILVPATLEEGSPSRHNQMMFAHELAHVHRRDLLWLWLSTFTQLLFFFHPLIRLAIRENRLAQEIACDELAILCAQAPPADMRHVGESLWNAVALRNSMGGRRCGIVSNRKKETKRNGTSVRNQRNSWASPPL